MEYLRYYLNGVSWGFSKFISIPFNSIQAVNDFWFAEEELMGELKRTQHNM